MATLKPSSLAWARLNSVPVIRAARANITRKFVAHLVGHERKLKSLDDLENTVLNELNRKLATQSNDTLEHSFLEFLKGPTC
jgi:hypothetical protein